MIALYQRFPCRIHMCGPTEMSMSECRAAGTSVSVKPRPRPAAEAGIQHADQGQDTADRNTAPRCACCDDHVTVTGSRRGRGSEYYCEKDLYIQVHTFAALLLGCFFYPELNSTEAKHLLKSSSVGTFIVRNSSDPRYIYTVSVKTKRGPTSIRITYERGNFSLDADEKSKNKMPSFQTLLDLIDYYVRLTSAQRSQQCRFVDRSGKKDLPIILSAPKLKSVSSLKHIARLTINRSLPATRAMDIPDLLVSLPLPPRLKSFIKDYPYLH